MANGDYATELLIRWTPHTLACQWQPATTRLTLLTPISTAYPTPPSSPMVTSDHSDPPTALSRSVAVLAHRYRSAAAQPQGGHSKAYCADGQSGQFVSVVRHGE